MTSRYKKIRYVLLRWICFAIGLCLLLLACFIKIKPLVFTYAKSRAETIMLNAANTAILSILERNDFQYDEIADITLDDEQNITGIQIDAKWTNMFKSVVSKEIEAILEKQSDYTVSIPVGTFFGNEFTTGLGPEVDFKMRLTETAVVDFKNQFESVGINNVLHQVVINIDISANILMIGCTEGFDVKTSAIAAQTVIAGKVPSSFTQVEEHPGDDLADEIFNYAGLEK